MQMFDIIESYNEKYMQGGSEMKILFFLVSFAASTVGAICGIGGGVIIKPALDMFQMESVSTISFLSGCAVLSMSLYAVAKELLTGKSKVDLKAATPLAVGAALGGVFGKLIFTYIIDMGENVNRIGAVQALCLLIITVFTLVYTVKKNEIKTRHITSKSICSGLGILLGITSSFLGIGGGPVNIILLHYFFTMDSKTAAQNSLYIIFFSQAANLIATLITNTVPDFNFLYLLLMIMGGILGGMTGRLCHRYIGTHTIDKLFILLMGVIIIISIYNVFQYSVGL